MAFLIKSAVAVLGLSIFSPIALHADTVAWWRFEQNGESEVDASSLKLTLSSTAQFIGDVPISTLDVEGKSLENHFAYINGKSDYGSRFHANPKLNDLFAYKSFTVEAFVRLDEGAETKDYLGIIGNLSDSLKKGWGIRISRGSVAFEAFEGLYSAPVQLMTKQTLQPKVWYHVAVVGYRTPDQLALRIFINGEEQEVKKLFYCYPPKGGGAAIVPSSGEVIVGGRNAFAGAIDELRISDTALLPEEFLKLTPAK